MLYQQCLQCDNDPSCTFLKLDGPALPALQAHPYISCGIASTIFWCCVSTRTLLSFKNEENQWLLMLCAT